MDPMQRRFGGPDDWRSGTRSFGPYASYGSYGAYGSYVDRTATGFAYVPDEHGHGSELYRGDAERPRRGEHTWRGGLLGWLGSGLRAGAAWVGEQMQDWGALLGGKLKGSTEELSRAMRSEGERVGSAMEDRGEDLMRFRHDRDRRGRPSRSYRRPDDRILDDVHQRVAVSGVDADEVEIEVGDGIVTLSGRVPRRFDKHLVEEIAEQVFGVQEVRNHLRLARSVEQAAPAEGTTLGPNGGGAAYGPGTQPLG